MLSNSGPSALDAVEPPSHAPAASPLLDVRLVRAQAEDVAALHKLELSCFDAALAFNRRQIHSLIANPLADFWALQHGDETIGQLIILRRKRIQNGSARIYSLTIAPHFRSRGLARRLLIWGIEELIGLGVAKIHLEVEATALAPLHLYKSFGFVEEKILSHYYGEGRHGIKMCLDVTTMPIPG